MKNHLGSYECKLCLTLHNNEVMLDLYLFTFIEFVLVKTWYFIFYDNL
jgi:hypothetical protein